MLFKDKFFYLQKISNTKQPINKETEINSYIIVVNYIVKLMGYRNGVS